MNKHLIKLATLATLCLTPFMVSQAESLVDQVQTIHVIGNSKLEIEPDQAIIYVNVNAHDQKNIASARNKVEDSFNKIIKSLKNLNIKDQDLIAENLFTYKSYDYDQKPPKIIDYIASRNLIIQLQDLKALDRVIDLILDDQTNTEIRNISYTVKDKPKYAQQAKDLAIRDSIQQAKLVSSGFNANVKKVLKIDYNQNYDLIESNVAVSMAMAPKMMSNSMSRAKLNSSDAYFKPKKITLSDSVNVIFEIEGGNIQ